MYKNERFVNAGTNEFYRYGKKAVEKIKEYLIPKNGFYSIPTDGGNYWTIGTSTGKFGEFCKFGETIFSVNSYGFAYAKEGTEKAESFKNFINAAIRSMEEKNLERAGEEYDA